MLLFNYVFNCVTIDLCIYLCFNYVFYYTCTLIEENMCTVYFKLQCAILSYILIIAKSNMNLFWSLMQVTGITSIYALVPEKKSLQLALKAVYIGLNSFSLIFICLRGNNRIFVGKEECRQRQGKYSRLFFFCFICLWSKAGLNCLVQTDNRTEVFPDRFYRLREHKTQRVTVSVL